LGGSLFTQTPQLIDCSISQENIMSETATTSSQIKNIFPSPTEKKFLMSRHALAGATIAVLLAVSWVIEYLASTVYGIGGFGNSLFAIVLGQEHGIGTDGAEALLVVVSRFIIGFGLSWGPITAIMAAVWRD